MKISNTETDQVFQSNNNSNFQMDVNGFRISIFFGPGAYVNDSNIRYGSYNDPMQYRVWGSDSAEVRVWLRSGAPVMWDNGDTVIGFCSSDTVARFIGCLIGYPQDEDPTEVLNQIYNAQV